jgi:hypothetical protein
MKACVDYTAQQYVKSGHNAQFAKGIFTSNQDSFSITLANNNHRNHINIRAD